MAMTDFNIDDLKRAAEDQYIRRGTRFPDLPREYFKVLHEVDLLAVVAEIERLTSSLRRCAVAASNSTSGDEEKDAAAIGGALEMALDDVEGFVNDQLADLECAVAQRDAEIERLTAAATSHAAKSAG